VLPHSRIVVIGTSAARRSVEAGFVEHPVKPFDPERLLEMLKRLGRPTANR
jgi:CheY-like chemotaxis protein